VCYDGGLHSTVLVAGWWGWKRGKGYVRPVALVEEGSMRDGEKVRRVGKDKA
jgi:hypothetical protein